MKYLTRLSIEERPTTWLTLKIDMKQSIIYPISGETSVPLSLLSDACCLQYYLREYFGFSEQKWNDQSHQKVSFHTSTLLFHAWNTCQLSNTLSNILASFLTRFLKYSSAFWRAFWYTYQLSNALFWWLWFIVRNSSRRELVGFKIFSKGCSYEFLSKMSQNVAFSKVVQQWIFYRKWVKIQVFSKWHNCKNNTKIIFVQTVKTYF